MNLIEALETLRTSPPKGTATYNVYLACGFTPLHLQTFLSAHLRKALPLGEVEITTGLYGDLKGNLDRLECGKCDAIAAVVEWQDMDSRLGIRNLGGWRVTDVEDIVESARRSLQAMERRLTVLSRGLPIVVCMPTLPLPPLFWTSPEQAGEMELCLRELAARTARSLAAKAGIRVASAQALDERSPMSERFDLKSEILYGFPYRVSHASIVGETLASLVKAPTPKKGIITDLDDTLWAGLVGETGSAGVSWHLEQGAHLHGLFQQFLASLASSGALVGIASKNDLQPVEEVLARDDLILTNNDIYPVVASWRPKPESIREILCVWNVAPDSVVFVDDSPIEVAEVKAAFPDMECILFPKEDYQGVWRLLHRLRGLFGKPFTSEEDRLRLSSIRDTSGFQDVITAEGSASEDFISTLNASVTFILAKAASDRRWLELLNKTNQFNLNGRRFTESQWMAEMANPASILLGVSYRDKFGALGKISVLLGRKEDATFIVESWVLSCRAFSRRIEYQTLAFLFDRIGAAKAVFRYEATPRNKVISDFLKTLCGEEPRPGIELTSRAFREVCPRLFQQVSVHE